MTLTAADWTAALGTGRVRHEVPLAPFTTFGVGGPAEWLIEPADAGELAKAAGVAREHGVPVSVLGGGSNVLVSDSGVPGLVMRIRTGVVAAEGADTVRADAGVSINGLVRWTIVHGMGGLEAWAGTPGTVGGAICGNAHFGGELIGGRVVSASLLEPDGAMTEVPASEMAFGYDRSRLQAGGEVLLSALFRVTPGCDPDRLRSVARRSLLHRKRTQPLHLRSAGCVFQNPVPGRDRVPEGCPWSAGALIDRAGLKNLAISGARVSPVHANFIVNEGAATAADIRALVQRCRQAVLAQFGVELRDEIVYLGSF